jgi:tricorn protease
MNRLLLICLAVASSAYSVGETVAQPFLRSPAISQDHVAFLLKNQLWIADRDGSNARRLLDMPGRQWSPAFSPDGKELAFTADFGGNLDVYTVAIAGGGPKRTTYFSRAFSKVTQWTKAGILFNTNARSFYGSADQIFLASGGMPKKMPIPYGTEGSLSRDGRYLAYTPLLNNFNEFWKRYRGGMHRNLWLLDRQTGKNRQTSFWKGTDCAPMWHGNQMVFLSDADPHQRLNLWILDARSGNRRQLTHLTEFDIRNPSYTAANGGEVIFEYGPKLFVYSLPKKTVTQIKISIPDAVREVPPRDIDAGRNLTNLALSSDGSHAIAEARGDLWLLSKDRDPQNLTATSGAFERFPVCSLNGKAIAYFSDETGENQLWLMNTSPGRAKKQITHFKSGYFSDPKWSPDSSKVAFVDALARIWIVDVGTGSTIEAAHDSLGLSLTFAWSADSQTILFNRTGPNRITALCSYDVRTRRTIQLGYGAYNDYWPASSRERIYFMSDRDYSRPRFDVTDNQYALSGVRVVLSAPASLRTATPEQFERAAEQLPIRSGRMSHLSSIDANTLVFTRVNETGERPLVTFDTSTKQERVVAPNVFNTPSFDASKERCLVQTPEGAQIVSMRGSAPPTSLKTGPMPVLLDPRAEWRQIERDAWRLCRDIFCNPNNPLPDWNRLWRRYEPMLQACMTRDDVNDVIQQMLGELSTSHAWVSANGDTEPGPAQAAVGTLGCDYEVRSGRYVFAKIYDFPWHAGRKAPLAGSGIAVGDALVAVNGKPLNPAQDVSAHFVGFADKDVELGILTRSGSRRSVSVRPMGSEVALRYASWVEERRRQVEKLSGGRLGYIHVTGLRIQDLADFKRQLDSASAKDGVVVDLRWSLGGFLSDIWAQMLARTPLVSFAVREGGVMQGGGRAPRGPVALIVNAITLSAGEGLSYNLRKMKVGRSFGTRTWGGFVGLNGNPELIDGGAFLIPNAPFFDNGKWVIENRGFVPDELIADDPRGMTDPQLERAVRWAMGELRRNPPARPLRPKR